MLKEACIRPSELKVLFSATHIGAILAQHSLLRAIFELRRCRPEQWWCYDKTTKSAAFNHVNGATLLLALSLALFIYRNWRFIKVKTRKNIFIIF